MILLDTNPPVPKRGEPSIATSWTRPAWMPAFPLLDFAHDIFAGGRHVLPPLDGRFGRRRRASDDARPFARLRRNEISGLVGAVEETRGHRQSVGPDQASR